ncbi:MAG: ABC transporter ATP-binding protein [Planctomycetes bacterium]|nr:ABC transporter ATP-binding protein [Planctomycetota bacterium]
MIELENVSKHYGKKLAVSDLSLRIEPGEFFAVLGPNGAGKTTTIKMIAGLLRPSSGRVRVCGFDVEREPLKAKRLMSYVPDQPFLYDKLSGLEFLHFIADMYDMPSAERDREIDRLCEVFAMKEWIRELCESYSHGMKQRVVLAATLLHHPKVIVVDEPMVGLDPHSARLVRGIFQEEARRGTSIFMSTHVISIAEECAGRIGIVMQGKLVAVGGMEELRRQAQSDGKLEDVFFKITENGHSGPT